MKSNFWLFMIFWGSSCFGQAKQDTKARVESFDTRLCFISNHDSPKIQSRYDYNLTNKGTQIVDLNSRVAIELTNPLVPKSDELWPFGGLIRSLEFTIYYAGEIYGPFIIDESNGTPDKSVLPILRNDNKERFIFTPKSILSFAKEEVLEKMTNRTLNDLRINVKVNWFSSKELKGNPGGTTMMDVVTYQNSDENFRISRMFTLEIKHFGLIFIADFSPLLKDKGTFSLDVLSGITKVLQTTTLDYSYNFTTGSWTNLLVTASILRFDGRDWWMKNIDIQYVGATEIVSGKPKNVGMGAAIGLFGPRNKILKLGLYSNANSPNWFIGISLRGLSDLVSN